MTRIRACALALLGTLTAARAANPVYEAQAAEARRLIPENRARVTAAVKAAALPNAQAVWFAVPAMSDRMRLGSTYPVDGRLNGELRYVAAQDEFEAASFQIYSFADKRNVTLTPSPFVGEGGATLPPAAVDINVTATKS